MKVLRHWTVIKTFICECALPTYAIKYSCVTRVDKDFRHWQPNIPSIIVGVDRGVPQPRFPPPYPQFPPPRPPASIPLVPHFPPLRIFLPPPSKKQQQQQVISSYNLSFQCMDYYQSFKTVGQFVGPVDNIVVRPSRVCREREKTKEDRIDERKNVSAAGPRPTITIRLPDTVSYPAPSPNPTANCRPDFRACGHKFTQAFIVTHGMS